MNDTLASTRCRTARPRMPEGLAEALHRRLTTLRSIVESWHDRSWRERIRFRWELERMTKDNPHLIDDIGLTKRQVEAELAKPFWQR
ncbi:MULTISPECIES: DUF1127 domain-containing protein [unclassified Mesorhizobium]|uniref:DUF1127 domain-containing protein n=1 Tax=unclassified Mesorhizobium TaxID=325217 RepID=UPI0029621FE4|nr:MULTISPECIES: DUF1127 domain-containing protein [unclassified Mesorhizobium]